MSSGIVVDFVALVHPVVEEWGGVRGREIDADAFYTDTNYQSDKIHYNATGHRIIANMVSGALGFPLYLQG